MQTSAHLNSSTLLMSAAQSMIYPEAYRALSHPVITQKNGFFTTLARSIDSQLHTLFGATIHTTLLCTGSGFHTLEMCLCNFLRPSASVLVLINGLHSKHISKVLTRCAYDVDSVVVPWGEPILPEAVKPLLERKAYDLVIVTHAENSTGVVSPMTALGHMVHDTGALFMVDCITSLGGMPVSVDSWQADIAYGVGHACLSCPAGLSFMCLSEKAMSFLYHDTRPLPTWDHDLRMLLEQWQSPEKNVYTTLPISLIYALNASLATMLNENLRNVYARHRSVQIQTINAMVNMGFQCFASSAWRAPMVSVFIIPEHIKADDLRRRLLEDYQIDIHDSFNGDEHLLRIGHMGHTARSRNVARLAEAIAEIIEID